MDGELRPNESNATPITAAGTTALTSMGMDENRAAQVAAAGEFVLAASAGIASGLGEGEIGSYKPKLPENAGHPLNKWLKLDGDIRWPENAGFLGTPRATVLKPGTVIDRYGYEGGNFAAPQGTPIGQRSLAPGTVATKPYHVYQVVKPLNALEGPSAPWFDEDGLGIQYKFSISMSELIEQGYIKEIAQ